MKFGYIAVLLLASVGVAYSQINLSCLLPYVCKDELLGGVVGAVACTTICLTAGLTGGRCDADNYPTYGGCVCESQRGLLSPLSGLTLSVLSLGLPTACRAACITCGKSNGVYSYTATNTTFNCFCQ